MPYGYPTSELGVGPLFRAAATRVQGGVGGAVSQGWGKANGPQMDQLVLWARGGRFAPQTVVTEAGADDGDDPL